MSLILADSARFITKIRGRALENGVHNNSRRPCVVMSLSGVTAERDGAARLSRRDFLHFSGSRMAVVSLHSIECPPFSLFTAFVKYRDRRSTRKRKHCTSKETLNWHLSTFTAVRSWSRTPKCFDSGFRKRKKPSITPSAVSCTEWKNTRCFFSFITHADYVGRRG